MESVSVIMPCFNHAKFLSDSVNGILQQTHENLELIIVDDCSRDNSWEEVTRLAALDARIRAVRHTRNQGPSKSRNTGLRTARGDFMSFCDADDIWEQGKLEHQLYLLRQTSDCGVAYSDAAIIDAHGSTTGQRFSDLYPVPAQASGALFYDLLKTNFVNTASVVLRRECFQRVGYFENRIRNVEDWWYWIQLSRHYGFCYTPEPLARYRVHNRSTNRVNQRGYSVNRFKVYKRIFRHFNDLPHPQKSESVFGMGAELCTVGRRSLGRRLLWNAVGLSARDIRCAKTLCKALRRLALS